jgi:DUF1009 family protein
MPVYSIPLSDEKILQEAADAKRILITGCGACANISCNIYRDRTDPVFRFFLKPVSMIGEISRLKAVLEENKHEVESIILMGLCSGSVQKRKKIMKMAEDQDAVIVMSCTAGKHTVSDAVRGKRIIHGMQVRGFKSIRMKTVCMNTYIESVNE